MRNHFKEALEPPQEKGAQGHKKICSRGRVLGDMIQVEKSVNEPIAKSVEKAEHLDYFEPKYAQINEIIEKRGLSPKPQKYWAK